MTRRGKGYTRGPITVTRKLLQIGETFYISIPRQFIDKHGLQKGDLIPIVADSILKIIPMKEIL